MSLTFGNFRLGAIWQFSIPAKKSCPGRSGFCSRVCYADTGLFRMPSVIAALERSFALTKSKGFANWMCAGIVHRRIRLLRIHVAGDFYSDEYIGKWLEIVRRSRRTTFFCYTRSWRGDLSLRPGTLELLQKLALERNMRLWLSCDRETGQPPAWENTRTAYLAEDDSDWPVFPVNLIFRDKPKSVVKKQLGTDVLVCAKEQGVALKVLMTCERCQLCFRKDRQLWRDEAAKPSIVKPLRVRRPAGRVRKKKTRRIVLA